MNRFVLWVAEGFGIGRIPVMPGTFGSFVGFGWLGLLLCTGTLWVVYVGILVGFVLSVWLCGLAERILQKKDPGSIVLDEITAFPICFLPWIVKFWSLHHSLPGLSAFFAKGTWYATAGIFVAFRVFDVLKPWPIRASQSFAGGWGVTIDDFLAGGYVLLLVWAGSLFGLSIR